MTGSSNFDNPYAANLIGLWDFLTGSETKDTGLDDGVAQDGTKVGGGTFSGGRFDASGKNTYFDVEGNDNPFQLDAGTLVTQFTQVGDPAWCDYYSTVVSRGEAADAYDEGFFEVRVTDGGALQVRHIDNGAVSLLSSADGFVGKGDSIRVTYSWDEATGTTALVENTSDGTSVTLSNDVTGLTFDITDNDDESFTIGGQESDDGTYDKFFDGKIDYVAILDEPVLLNSGDGVVEGTSGNDTIDILYTGDPEGDKIDNEDAILPGEAPNDDIVDAGAGDDIIKSGKGDDTVYAGSGDDTVEGGEGNDVIFGDSNLDPNAPAATEREVFKWSDANTFGDEVDVNSITQNTGNVDVTFSVLSTNKTPQVEFETASGNTSGIDTGGLGSANPNSNLAIETNSNNESAKVALDFSGPVQDVSFRINDADFDSVVLVQAFDKDGNLLPVELTGGSKVTLSDTDTAAGNDTATSNGGGQSPAGSDYSILVGIAGPVARIEITHSQDGDDTSHIQVTDVYFDAIIGDPGAPGDDVLFGNDGDDEIYGEDGNDIIDGGKGNDLLDGGDGDDDIKGGRGNDTITGGDGLNRLDGGKGDDKITGGDDKDVITGGDGSDTVDGGDGDDIIDTSGGLGSALPDRGFPPYNGLPGVPADPDPFNDRDVVDGGDGDDTIITGDDNDIIMGGDGEDKIDGGLDDDTIDGGDDDDFIVGGEGSDNIKGGDGDDTIYGGLDPSFPDALNIPDDGSAGPADPVTDNGKDVIDGGDGNDTIFGQDDDDLIFGGDGEDVIDGGIDDDTIFGGDDSDTIMGGQGNDAIDGGAGADTLFGGADRDTFTNITAGDKVDGNEEFSLNAADDFDTLDLTGSAENENPGGSLTIEYDPTNAENGIVTYFDADGNATGTVEFKNIENVIPCFTPGTLIATPTGERKVEDLEVGDRVITRDNGIQEIRWVGQKTLNGIDLIHAEHLRPVLIRAGALGNGLPERDMMVSPNHRVLVSNDKTALYFEDSEVLVAAKHLTGLDGVDVVEASHVTYIHFMFDQHEVVLSDGAWTESFQPGDMSLKGIGNAQRNEIFELFPELKTRKGLDAYRAARRSLKKHEALLLVR